MSTLLARLGGRLRATGAFLPLVALAVASFACGRGGPRFENTFATPRDLAVAVVAALEARDRAALERLALSEDEFREKVFPEMPAWGKIPMTYVWDDLRQKSGHQLAGLLDALGGQSFSVKRVIFDGGATPYKTFVVHRKPRLLVQRRPSGEKGEIALFGSVIEVEGRYKLFSYVVNR